MHLNRQAGWNQTKAAWLRFLAMAPDGCFVAELEGRTVKPPRTSELLRSGQESCSATEERVLSVLQIP